LTAQIENGTKTNRSPLTGACNSRTPTNLQS